MVGHVSKSSRCIVHYIAFYHSVLGAEVVDQEGAADGSCVAVSVKGHVSYRKYLYLPGM